MNQSTNNNFGASQVMKRQKTTFNAFDQYQTEKRQLEAQQHQEQQQQQQSQMQTHDDNNTQPFFQDTIAPPSTFDRNLDDPNAINCHCGNLAAKREVKKDGPTKGKFFYCCAKNMEDESKCKYFEFEDQIGKPKEKKQFKQAPRVVQADFSSIEKANLKLVQMVQDLIQSAYEETSKEIRMLDAKLMNHITTENNRENNRERTLEEIKKSLLLIQQRK